MEFKVSNDELFLKIDIAAKFLACNGDSSSFLTALTNDVILYTPLNGMYEASYRGDSVTIFCSGFARLYQSDNKHSLDYYARELWKVSHCDLYACSFTEGNLPIKEKHRYSLVFQGDNFPKNGNFINYAYINLAELAKYCKQAGIEVGVSNIEQVCLLACNFNFLSLLIDNLTLDEIKEQSYFPYFLKHFPIIPAKKQDAVLERIREIYVHRSKVALESNSKQCNKKSNDIMSELAPTESTYSTLGALLALLKENNNYKSDAELIELLEDKYFGVRGFSKRSLQGNFKKGKDALGEAQKR